MFQNSFRVWCGVMLLALFGSTGMAEEPCRYRLRPLEDGLYFGYVRSILEDGSGLLMGGGFRGSLTVDSDDLIRWDGEQWAAFSPEPPGEIGAMAFFDDGTGEALYIAGATGTTTGYVARLDGGQWTNLGLGVNGPVRCMVVADDGQGPALYVGGDFTVAGGEPANRVAKWNGTSWSAVGLGPSGSQNARVQALYAWNDGTGLDLYAGGFFTTAGGQPAAGVARWDGEQWSDLDGGVDGRVSSFHRFDDGNGPALYVGGDFTAAGGEDIEGVARWDGTGWSAVGPNAPTRVESMVTFDDGSGPKLYAGGVSTDPATSSRSFVSRWNGQTWDYIGHPVGGNIGPQILVLAVTDGTDGQTLYVGGAFDGSCGLEVPLIGRWVCDPADSCPSDIDRDGQVNLSDLNLFLSYFTSNSTCGDVNWDGAVNLADLNAVLAAFGTSCE